MTTRTKRTTTLPLKLRDNGLPATTTTTTPEVWCSILLENHEEQEVMARDLENDLGDPLQPRDLWCGNKVIWRHRNTPYESEILGISKWKQSSSKKRGAKYLEDSDSEDETQRPRKQKKHSDSDKKPRKQTLKDRLEVSNSDDERPNKQKHHVDKLKQKKESQLPMRESSPLSSGGFDEEPVKKGFSVPFVTHVSSQEKPKAHSLKTKERQDLDSTSTFSYPSSRLLHSSHVTLQDLKDVIVSQSRLLTELRSDMSRVIKYMKHSVQTNERQSIRSVSHYGHTQREKPLSLVKAEDNKENTNLTEEVDDKFIMDNGMNLLHVRGSDPIKYALSLMDAIFSESEMADHCYEANNRTTKPGLDPKKVNLLEDCIQQKFGIALYRENERLVKKKCNQKCLDKRRLVKLQNQLASTGDE